MSFPDGWTRETPAPGLVCYQPRRGYRYGVEAYALAAFALDPLPVRALDLGTGSGIVALLMASRGVAVTGIERDERWAEGWERSVAESGLTLRLLRGDVRNLPLPSVDVAVANPPWFDPAAGPRSPDDHKANARTALAGGPAEFVAAGLRCAPRVCVVVPASVGLPNVPDAGLRRRARVGGLLLGEYVVGPSICEEVAVDPYARFR